LDAVCQDVNEGVIIVNYYHHYHCYYSTHRDRALLHMSTSTLTEQMQLVNLIIINQLTDWCTDWSIN